VEVYLHSLSCLLDSTLGVASISNVRGRVSRQVKSDVIGFLCVSQGSSTNQLHDNLGSRRACACSEAGFSSQNGDPYLWNDLPKSSVLLCVFWGQKDSMQRIFIKIRFLFMVGSVYRVK
jgi:hypothetical protein